MRPCGLVPTPAGVAPWGTFGASTDGPAACDRLSPLALRGLRQRGESCVWHAVAGALWVTCQVVGLPPVLLDPYVGYYATRKRSVRGGAIHDTGCRPTDAAMVLRELGLAPWDRVAPTDVNAEPAWDRLCLATHSDWFRMSRIVATGEARSLAIRRALSAPGREARPVLVGQAIDDVYTQWRPGMAPWRRTGDIVGRHMELAASYDQRGVYLVGSWGDDFDRLVSWEQLEGGDATDLWIPYIEPGRVPR